MKEGFIIKNNNQKGFWTRINDWFKEQIVSKKLNTPLGYALIALAALLLGAAIGQTGMSTGLMALVVILGVPALGVCIFNQKIGIGVITTIAFFLLGVKKYVPGNLPLGIFLDLLIFLLFFGLFVNQIKERDWSFAKSPISVIVIIWIAYNLVEVLNPWAASRMAWFYTVRGLAGIVMLYFIAAYAINSLKNAKIITNIIIFLCFLAGVYGIYQEFFGFTQTELRWIHADEQRYKLIFQWGRYRKFSFLSDPMTFGILSAYAFSFVTVLFLGPRPFKKKILLGIVMFVTFMGMIYAGTRTAYVLVPIGMIFFTALTLRKDMILLSTLGVVGIFLLTLVPTSNANLYRFQSAFKPNEDKSMNTRLNNQKNIQPFIQENPLGGGLGSTGTWGKRFSPDNPLANFPPDSGFVRIAVELGWLGLLIYCALFFVVIRTGIYNYVRCRNPEIRNFYAAYLTLIFCLTVANYPQEAVITVPNNVVFYIAAAMLVRLKDFDTIPEEEVLELSSKHKKLDQIKL